MDHETPPRTGKLKSNSILQNLFNQRTEGNFCDVEIHLNGKIVRVHSCILASQSEYFIERFQPLNAKETSWETHWCYVRPLVIDLVGEMDVTAEHCFMCLSKVVDYMYLKELVVTKGHCLHFFTYAQFFKMLELIALCKTYNKNIDLSVKGHNEVKSPRVSAPKENIAKGCSSEENSETQNNSDFGGKCEFVCCSEDLEPSTAFSEHSNRRSISCELCTFRTVSVKTMLKHVEKSDHYGTKCSICKLKVSDEKDLKYHFKDHEGPKPYFCHICKKRTSLWDTHKLHFKVHCRNKPFSCGVCQKSFKTQKNMVVHMASHEESSFSCDHCTYFTPDFKTFKIHLEQHSSKCQENKSSSDTLSSFKEDFVDKSNKFICQACGKQFTLKKNLKRHVQLNHFGESQDLKCQMCEYVPKRMDMLKKHLINKHHLKIGEINKILDEARKVKKQKGKSEKVSDIMGVLIPVKLVSTSDATTLDAFAVRTRQNEEISADYAAEINDSVEINCDDFAHNAINNETIVGNGPENVESGLKSSTGTFEINDLSSERFMDSTRTNIISNEICEENHVPYRLPMEAKGIGATDEIWLNESTGELLSGSGYVNLHLLNSNLRKTIDVNDSYKTILLNDPPTEISVGDFIEDKEDYFSNPQTPQTNVDFDDAENLIALNRLESKFCSTWVLNEATGELNLVSFNINPLNDSDNLQVNKSWETSVDDDDTALFLNEGTGDLSVIYFNPQSSNDQTSDKCCPEVLETMSDHSDDEEIDFLNEQLLRASTNFMADDGNEKFLNELTGEFDVASFSRFQTDVLAYQTPDNSMYLNEETGEISWNVLDQFADSDIVTTNSDILNLDFDDSVNCEELNSFSVDGNFPAEFCMTNGASRDWQNMDESCDTLLNECTGELVPKT